MVNANYIMAPLGKFMKVVKQKRLGMAAGDWWFYRYNAQVHTATMVIEWIAVRQIQIIQHPPICWTWYQ